METNCLRDKNFYNAMSGYATDITILKHWNECIVWGEENVFRFYSICDFTFPVSDVKWVCKIYLFCNLSSREIFLDFWHDYLCKIYKQLKSLINIRFNEKSLGSRAR